LTLKEIAEERGRDEATGAIDHKVSVARKNARLVMDDLLDELRGEYDFEMEDD